MVMGCILPPPVILALGMKLALTEVRKRLTKVKGKLMMVYRMQNVQIQFVLQPKTPYYMYIMLQVCEQYIRLLWY
jgi:hypothetical protein